MKKLKNILIVIGTFLMGILAFVMLKPNNTNRKKRKESKKKIKEIDNKLVENEAKQSEVEKEREVVKNKIVKGDVEIKELENKKKNVKNTNKDVKSAIDHLGKIATK